MYYKDGSAIEDFTQNRQHLTQNNGKTRENFSLTSSSKFPTWLMVLLVVILVLVAGYFILTLRKNKVQKFGYSFY